MAGDPDAVSSRPQIAVTAKPVLTANGLGVTLSLGSVGTTGRSFHASYCFLTGLFYVAIGIACLVVVGPRRVVFCGQEGSPPLVHWVYATGISYTVIAGAFFFIWVLLRTGDNRDPKTISFHPDCKLPLIAFLLFLPFFPQKVTLVPSALLIFLSLAFTVAWTIVGAVSLWRDGVDCGTQDFTLWQMGMAAVILSIILVVISLLALILSSRKKTKVDDGLGSKPASQM